MSDFRAPEPAAFAPAVAVQAEIAPQRAESVATAEDSKADDGKKAGIAALSDQVEGLKQQVATLEKRCDDQDAAVRRILGLLIEWVEQGDAADAPARGRAA